MRHRRARVNRFFIELNHKTTKYFRDRARKPGRKRRHHQIKRISNDSEYLMSGIYILCTIIIVASVIALMLRGCFMTTEFQPN